MNKLKVVPRFIKEIILTVISYAVLWALWNFILKEYIVLSSQALSTIGLALSTSVGVLTAIIVSFVLIAWQSSRQERSTSYWRWRYILHQLFDFYDANLEVLWEMREEVAELTGASSAVALVDPMPRDNLKELTNKVWSKITSGLEELQGVKRPSDEQVKKGRAYTDITNYLVDLYHC